MELSSALHYEGWTIKYGIFAPDNVQQNELRTVVFVHGTPWSSEVFWPITKALLARKRYRILLYDLPGYGLSQELDSASEEVVQTEKFVGDTSIKFQASALAELLDRLRLSGKDGRIAPAVIAHDIAGTIALRAHLIHQCDFSSLLLLDTNTVLPWGDGFYKLVRSEPDTFLKLPPSIFEAVVRAVIRSAVFNPGILDSGWDDILARPWIASDFETAAQGEEKQQSFIRQIAQANDADVAEMLDQDLYTKVRCDVKIMWGERDQWIPREKMERLAGMLKPVLKEFVVIPEAGHLVMIDQPEQVACEIFSWLAER